MKTDYEIKIGEIFQLELVANPSTGYSWKWTNQQAGSIVEAIDAEFIPARTNVVGSKGKEIWRYKGIRSGTALIKLEYNRSWEPNSTVDTKTITVTVK